MRDVVFTFTQVTYPVTPLTLHARPHSVSKDGSAALGLHKYSERVALKVTLVNPEWTRGVTPPLLRVQLGDDHVNLRLESVHFRLESVHP